MDHQEAEEGSKSPVGSTNGDDKTRESKSGSKHPHTKEMKKVFEQFDANKDGVISSDELTRFMEGLGFKVSQEDVQALVKAVDDDCNGTVDFDEFFSLYSSITGGDEKATGGRTQEEVNEANLKDAFRVFDKDADGYINPLELQSVLMTLGIAEGHSLKKCEEMINSVDQDANGKVDYKEFKKMMSSHWGQS